MRVFQTDSGYCMDTQGDALYIMDKDFAQLNEVSCMI